MLAARGAYLSARRERLLAGVPIPSAVARGWARYEATLAAYGGWPGVLRAQGVTVPDGAPMRMGAAEVERLLGG